MHSLNKPENRHMIIILAALSLFLASIEYLIPKPVPFMRLGLANIPILLSFYLLPRRGSLAITLLKITGQGILYGTLFSYVFLFSAAGSLAGFGIMLGLASLLKKRISPLGLAASGALFSNAAQLLLAVFTVFGKSALLFAPLLMISGEISAVLIGGFTAFFLQHSQWIKILRGESVSPEQIVENPDLAGEKTGDQRKSGKRGFLSPVSCLITGTGLIICLFVSEHLILKTALFIWIMLLNLFSGNRILWVRNLIFFASVVFMNSLLPEGEILFRAGPWIITRGALETGLDRALFFLSLLAASRLTLHREMKLPGTAGRLITEVFGVFSQMMEKRPQKKIKNPMRTLDRFLMESVNWNTALIEKRETPQKKMSFPKEILPGILLVLPAAAAVILTRIYS